MRNTLETIVESHEIIDFLKSSIQFKAVCHNILSRSIILEHAERTSLSVSDSEVQIEVDSFRRQMALEKASDTLAWLEAEAIAPGDWEVGIRDRLLTQKLKESLFAKDVEKVFHQNRVQYDKVMLYQLLVTSERLAQELFHQIDNKEISFFEAAHMYDIDEDRRDRCGYQGLLTRGALSAVLGAAVFGAEEAVLIPPVCTDEGYHLLLPQKFIKADLTSEVREVILEQLFREWLMSELNHRIQSSAIVKLSGS
jgi:parvulin-like peptidyl-prolyl isomerase